MCGVVLGQLTTEAMQQLERLTKDLFKGESCKAVESSVTATVELSCVVTE